MDSADLTRRTKIVCTIGPASDSPEMLESLLRAGMDVARLNFSHGEHESHGRVLDNLRQKAAELGRQVGVLQDLAGPKIRLGVLDGELELKGDDQVILVAGSRAPVGQLPVNYTYLVEDVEVGGRILLADGLVELKVLDKAPGQVRCRVTVGGTLSSHKGVNLPTSELRIPAFTEKDAADLEYGLKRGVDFVGVSFVRSAEDIAPVRQRVSREKRPPLIIAKIEKPQAVANLSEILKVVDGVMVARGDLGVEMPLEEVPLIQKDIIRRARTAGKVVITATQMLRSMIDNPRPTRAEATDVANAVLDGTDAVMLSEESAVGSYPALAARTLHKICVATETALVAKNFLKVDESHLTPASEFALSRAACWLAIDLSPAAIVASTTSGGTARLIARYRPAQPVVGLTPEPRTARQLALSWGVLPALVDRYEHVEDMLELAATWAKEQGLARRGDKLIVTAGVPVGVPGTTNMVKVVEVE